MASHETARSKNSYSTLLQLPGEIRNRIYDFAVESKTIVLTSLSCPDHFTLLPSAAKTANWSSLRRKYLGLSQTCRQLRAEFLPIYRRETAYKVYVRDVALFLDAILLSDGVQAKDVIGNVTVSLTKLDWRKLPSDLLHLIKVCTVAAHYSRLQVQFEGRAPSDDPLCKDLEHLLRPVDATKWQHFLETFVTKLVLVYGHSSSIGIELHVKPEYAIEADAGLDFHMSLCNRPTRSRNAVRHRAWGDMREKWEKSVGIEAPKLRKVMQIEWDMSGGGFPVDDLSVDWQAWDNTEEEALDQ